MDVTEEVTFFVIYLFIFLGGRGESDQMFGWGRGGKVARFGVGG